MYSCAKMEADFLFSTNFLDFSPEKVWKNAFFRNVSLLKWKWTSCLA